MSSAYRRDERPVERVLRRLAFGLPPATALILYAAGRGSSGAQLLILAVMAGAIAGVIVLPVGGIDLSTRTRRLRAAAATAGGGVAVPVLVLAFAAALTPLAGTAPATGLAAAISLAGSYALGVTLALALLSARARRSSTD